MIVVKILGCTNGEFRFRMLPHPTAGRDVYWGRTFLRAENDFTTFPTGDCTMSPNDNFNDILVHVNDGEDNCYGNVR